MNARDRAALAVLEEHGRGLIQLQKGSKAPAGKWATTKPLDANAAGKLLAAGYNIGLRTGAGVYVVDLDGTPPEWLAEALADNPTWTARTPRGGYHYYYATSGTYTNTAGKLAEGVDTRGANGYIVAPPSSVNGRGYAWLPEHAPGEIELAPLPPEILEAVTPPPPRRPAPPLPPGAPRARAWADAALAAELDKVRHAPPGTANNTLFTSTLAVREICEAGHLEWNDVRAQLAAAATERGKEAREIENVLRNAEKREIAPRHPPDRHDRTTTRPRDDDVPESNGAHDGECDIPDEAPPLPDAQPLTLAAAWLDAMHTAPDGRRLLIYSTDRADWFRYVRGVYVKQEAAALRASVYAELRDYTYAHAKERRRIRLKSSVVSDVLDAAPACGAIESQAPPAWRGGAARRMPDAAAFLALENGLLHIPTRRLHPLTPDYFGTSSLPFHYLPNAPEPTVWLAFLRQLWPEDQSAIDTLQEWIGYCLTHNTAHHKIALLLGPPRSGKGTIARIMQALAGPSAAVSPTFGSLAGEFGLQPLIGKRIAIIADARLSGRTDSAAVLERLLSISGEDTQTVNRKHKEAWTGKLDARFTLLTNELPRLPDASNALASRLLIFPMTESFLGREDYRLFSRLEAQLPAIFNWALDGLERLNRRGRFVQPECGAETLERFEELSSPVSAFVKDRCELAAGAATDTKEVFEAYKTWAGEQGRDHVGTLQTFSRDLRAACPAVQTRQVRFGGGRARVFEGIRLC